MNTVADILAAITPEQANLLAVSIVALAVSTARHFVKKNSA